MGEATAYWHMAFLFDTLCQMDYMIYRYITNANARINILSITAGCLLLIIHRRVLWYGMVHSVSGCTRGMQVKL